MFYDCSPRIVVPLEDSTPPPSRYDARPSTDGVSHSVSSLDSTYYKPSADLNLATDQDVYLEDLIGPVRLCSPKHFEAIMADDGEFRSPRLFLEQPMAITEILKVLADSTGDRPVLLGLPHDCDRVTEEQAARFAELGVSLIEGLHLENVPTGDYYLLALPINLSSNCCIPVRVVLKNVLE